MSKQFNNFLNLFNMYIPSYQINTSKTPVAMIFVNGKQIIFRKLPKNEYFFVDKDWGLFEIKPEMCHYVDKTPIYLYDARNQNPIDLPKFNELWKWANLNKLTKIKRKDIKQGIFLRLHSKDEIKKINAEELESVNETIDNAIKDVSEHNAHIDAFKKSENKNPQEAPPSMKKLTKQDLSFILISEFVKSEHITKEEGLILERRIRTKELDFDGFVKEMQSSKKLTVNIPLELNLERVLDDFHTYAPKDFIFLLNHLSKFQRGLRGLRTKPLRNWFPATYLLFGGLAVVLFLIMFSNGVLDGLFDGSFSIGI